MEKEFVPYELAVKLKYLGFDEPCFATLHTKTQKIIPIYGVYKYNPRHEVFWIKAPLWQQVEDFMLKKYNLYGLIIPTITMNWTFKTMTVVDGFVEVPPYNHVDANDYSTREEARKACLEKLIELVENETIQN